MGRNLYPLLGSFEIAHLYWGQVASGSSKKLPCMSVIILVLVSLMRKKLNLGKGFSEINTTGLVIFCLDFNKLVANIDTI